MDANPAFGKSGQSVVEFCIGLVAMLTVIAGVFQLGLMGLGRTRARVEATAEAATESMSDANTAFQIVQDYVLEVNSGVDERSYSMDDEQEIGGSAEVYSRLLQANQPSELGFYAPDNALSQMTGSVEMQAFTGLVRGSSTESGIPVLPIVRRLFFDQGSVDIEMEVWSVRTGGLY